MALLYFLFFAGVTALAHESYQTTAFDLGSMDQAIWNTLHGRILRVTVQPGVEIRLVGHVEPILLPISLLYLIYSDPKILLILQSAIVALGAFPAYWLARDFLGNRWLALVFPAVYLFHPFLQAANAFDFHPVTLAASFLLFALNALHRQRWTSFAIFSLLVMSCREDMPLLIMAMGLYALVFLGKLSRGSKVGASDGQPRGRFWPLSGARWVGLAAVTVGALWWYIALFVIPSRFAPQGQHAQLDRYSELGETWQEILGTLLLRPQVVWELLVAGPRLHYLINLLASLAFAPLAGLPILLIGFPTLAMNLLSNYEPMHTFGRFHYSAPLVPILVAAAALGVACLSRLASRLSLGVGKWASVSLCLIILAGGLAYQRLYGYTPLAEDFSFPTITEHHRLARRFEKQIPPQAVVSAQSRLLPHLSQRERIYMFPRVEDAQYVFLDVSADSWPIHPNDLKRQVENMLSGGFSIVDAADGYALLRRGEGLSEWPEEFYEFARTEKAEPQYPMVIDFEGELRFLGLDILSRGEMVYLRTYWQALRPIERDLRIYPFFFDDTSGRIIEDTTARPLVAALWYPTSRWRTDEVVVLETLPWDVGKDFSVGIGVLDGSDWSQEGRRYKLQVLSSPLIVRPFDDNTWAKVMEYRQGEPYVERRAFFASPSHPLKASLDRGPALVGWDGDRASAKPGEHLKITLHWQASDFMDESYTAFVHLIDREEKLVAQSDSIPLQGAYPTTWWLPGEVVADAHLLEVPLGARAGGYFLVAGMYDGQGRRLTARDEAGGSILNNVIPLGEIQVVSP